MPYGPITVEKVSEVLRRVHGYLESRDAGAVRQSRDPARRLPISRALTATAMFEPGAFRPISYEWGVTYSGMLLAAQTTGDPRFTDYVAKRMA